MCIDCYGESPDPRADPQDFYEDALAELALMHGVSPLPFIRLVAISPEGPVWGYAYVGAKNDLRSAIRAARWRKDVE